jgi:hypothetical protein
MLTQPSEKALDHEGPALARADSKKTDPGNLLCPKSAGGQPDKRTIPTTIRATERSVRR